MPGYRGTLVGQLTGQQYDIIDAAGQVAKELDTDVPSCAGLGTESARRQLNSDRR